MPSDHPLRSATAGFEGEITGLGLSDVIQLDVMNRFSGCIDVQYEDRRGLVFLKDGEIVHAEQGGLSGEAAFYEIVSWPGGRFSHQENVATTRSTIKKSCHFLILEAPRLVDERRAGRAPSPADAPAAAAAPAAPPPPAPAKAISADVLLASLKAIPGVRYAVIQGKDGARVGDDSYDGEKLGGQALYVALVARQLSDRLQGGEVHSAVVQGADRNLLVFAARRHLVTVLADLDAQVGAVEAAVRKALAQGRSEA